MDQELKSTPSGGTPQGLLQARVDEKGRLKLPVAAQQYIREFGDSRVFITSIDGANARIYPNSVWESNLEILGRSQDDPETTAAIYFISQAYGESAEVDSQGRVLLPTNLRRKLKLENEAVWLERFKGRLTLYNSQQYDEQMQRSLKRVSFIPELEKKGFR